MKVFVVYSEFNRGYDLESSAVVEGVASTEDKAKDIQKDAEISYLGMDCVPYGFELARLHEHEKCPVCKCKWGDHDQEEKDACTEEFSEDGDDWGVDVHIEEFEVDGE